MTSYLQDDGNDVRPTTAAEQRPPAAR